MSTRYRERERSLRNERGFTLPEVLTTVAILGILIAIAMAIWNSVIESRRVDAAANQLASDLRLAHTKATNQLTDWRVMVEPGERAYELRKLEESHEEEEEDDELDPGVEKTIPRSLPEGTKVLSTTAGGGDSPFIELNSDGSLYVVSGPNGNVQVSSTDGDPKRKITFMSPTSRIKLD